MRATGPRALSAQGWLLVAMIAAYLVVGWFSFDFQVPAHVTNDATRAESGARFAHGILTSRGAAPFLPTAIATREISVDLELHAARVSQRGPAVIFAVAADEHNADLLIGQSSRDIVVQVRRPWSTNAGGSGIYIPEAFTDTATHRVVVRLTDATLEVSLDGRRVATEQLGTQLWSAWDASYPVSLGNAPSGYDSWAGEITAARVDVGGRSTDLFSPGVLQRPGSWWELPWRGRSIEGSPNPVDVVVNIVGFVPLGMVVASMRRRSVLISAAAVGAAVSLAIELGQLFLPSRDPSLVDLATNVVGALLGATIVSLHRRRNTVEMEPPIEVLGRR